MIGSYFAKIFVKRKSIDANGKEIEEKVPHPIYQKVHDFC